MSGKILPKEILDFMGKNFPQYAWSARSLDRRLRYFSVYYIDKTVTVIQVQDAVQLVLNGPSELLGYRTMHQKLRQTHDLRVPRAMYEADPAAMENRWPCTKKKKEKGNFVSGLIGFIL
ncbi:uncharacterized protein LOC130614530 [Hydractinia symbiolongicarpus]|uniref:uncharacterized protein LOC130614530 n=1 Tax=Hydractinia symbiolongicarpus TaxID=13093 RepID=UPI00254BE7B4|nr:uncharacterized protein LOC130614530 [Hydractinia symbiolongicarpus]